LYGPPPRFRRGIARGGRAPRNTPRSPGATAIARMFVSSLDTTCRAELHYVCGCPAPGWLSSAGPRPSPRQAPRGAAPWP